MKENIKNYFLLTLLVFSFPIIFLFLDKINFFNSKIVYNANSNNLKEEQVNLLINKTINKQNENKFIVKATSSLIFVGDIMLSRRIGEIMVEQNDWTFPFQNVADVLRKADLTFGNLEGPVSSKGYDTGGLYSFRADPKSTEGLLFAGFDILSVANNHMWDYTAEALKDTFVILKNNNINYVGAGFDFAEAHTPVIKEINGLKIAFLAYTNLLPRSLSLKEATPAFAFPEKEQIILDLNYTNSLADFVVVSFHWGEEYQTKSNSYQQDLARFTIDLGADLIVGHHPHVVQEIEKYKNGYIAYSLGNFIFDQNFSKDTGNGLVVEVILKDDEILEIKKHRVEFNKNYQPFFVSSFSND